MQKRTFLFARCQVLLNAKKSPIYTRTGDKGTSALYNGTRRNKDDEIFEALGTVDELNASLGVASFYCTESANKLDSQLQHIQCRLLDLGSTIATPIDTSSSEKKARVEFAEAHIAALEKWIDTWDAQLPPLKNFILPSGGKAASFLHVARTICRRAERRVVPLVRDGQCPDTVQRYLNRLSDYLFVVARSAAAHEQATETVYKKE